MEPCGTPDQISIKDEHCPFKSVALEIIYYINQVSTYTVLVQLVNQSSMPDFIKGFWDIKE